MRLNFTYTPQDLQEITDVAAKQVARSQRRRPVGLALVAWVVFVMLAMFFFTLLNAPSVRVPGPRPSPWPQLKAFAPWITAFVVMWGLAWWSKRRAGRVMWTQNPSFQEPRTLEFDDDKVRVAYALVTTEWKWLSFVALVETTNLLLLKQGDSQYLAIPKRAVPLEELDALRLALNERLNYRGAFPVLPVKSTG